MELLTVINCPAARGHGGARPNPSIIGARCRVLLISAPFMHCVHHHSLCSAGITNENEFHISGSPTPRVSNDVTFSHAHTLCLAIWLL